MFRLFWRAVSPNIELLGVNSVLTAPVADAETAGTPLFDPVLPNFGGIVFHITCLLVVRFLID